MFAIRKSSPRSRKSAEGFTLIEALVVVLLVGLVSAVVTDSLTRVLDLRSRLASYLDSATSSRMTLNWLRRSAAGLVPDYIDGEDRFRGTPTEFTGISITAPGYDIGIPQRVSWRLLPNPAVKGVTLSTRLGEGPWVAVAEWPDRTGRFAYEGGDGQWVGEWPPAMGNVARLGAIIIPGQQVAPQIPRFIRVEVSNAESNWSAILVSDGPREGRQRTGDMAKSILQQ